MKGQDVWSKGTGVTKFRGSDRYDKADAGSPSVHSILAEGASCAVPRSSTKLKPSVRTSARSEQGRRQLSGAVAALKAKKGSKLEMAAWTDPHQPARLCERPVCLNTRHRCPSIVRARAPWWLYDTVPPLSRSALHRRRPSSPLPA